MSYPDDRFAYRLPADISADNFDLLDQRLDSSLPDAIQTLENEELQALIVALLREWRQRMETPLRPANRLGA
jgi:hypothetical protein